MCRRPPGTLGPGTSCSRFPGDPSQSHTQPRPTCALRRPTPPPHSSAFTSTDPVHRASLSHAAKDRPFSLLRDPSLFVCWRNRSRIALPQKSCTSPKEARLESTQPLLLVVRRVARLCDAPGVPDCQFSEAHLHHF